MSDAASSGAAALKLKVVQTGVAAAMGREMDLAGSVTWLGRTQGDIIVPDPGMSGSHAWLEVTEDGRLVIHDNESSNGVLVDGRATTECELVAGQRFTLGATTFEVIAADTTIDPFAEGVDGGTVLVQDFGELAAQFEKPAAFSELGEAEVIPANRPFLLSDSSTMWLIESGKVEIFTVAVEKGKPVGARSHFLSVDEGAAFFGLDADTLGFDSSFLAVAKAGTKLVRYQIDRLPLLAPVAAHREVLTRLVRGWVAALSRRLTSDVEPIPDPGLVLRPDEDLEVLPDIVTVPGNEVLWVEVPAARFLFDGMASLSYEAEGLLFPLAPGSWLELLATDEPVELKPVKTDRVIDDPRLWAGLGVFHRLLMECEFLNKKLAVVDEFQRLQRKADRAVAAREEGVGAIESVLGGTRKWEPVTTVGDAGPIFQAIQLIGQDLDLNVRKPPGDLDHLSFDEAVLSITTASRCRVRRVALLDDWWRQEQGTLLCWKEGDEGPVALIPNRKRKYEWTDPETANAPS